MPSAPPPSTTNSGIRRAADGSSYIPSSKRADGSTRKEIRVRPGYRPPEDVETYKNRNAEAWKNRASGGVPGAEPVTSAPATDGAVEPKSKNAKRREAARRKAAEHAAGGEASGGKGEDAAVDEEEMVDKMKRQKLDCPNERSAENERPDEGNVDRQKKTRNLLKKLRAIREVKQKKASGEKLSHDQLMKISKEEEIVRDLRKLEYDGSEISDEKDGEATGVNPDQG